AENELQQFSRNLSAKRPIPPKIISILQELPKNCDAMDALRVCVAALGVFDDPMYSLQEKSSSIAAKIGTIVAAIHRHKHDWAPIPPKDDLSYAANFLYMVTGKEPSESDTRLMNVFFIL
ncbi:MAG: citrate synthase, partial [Thaumarchaeota archaeon]